MLVHSNLALKNVGELPYMRRRSGLIGVNAPVSFLVKGLKEFLPVYKKDLLRVLCTFVNLFIAMAEENIRVIVEGLILTIISSKLLELMKLQEY